MAEVIPLKNHPGRIVYSPPPGGNHTCPYPEGYYGLPPGTIWRCDCGKAWTLTQSARRQYWRQATRRQLLKAKLARKPREERP